jgi:antitoxin ParD1/3/4
VVREALREWKLRRVFKQHEQAELKRLWEEGLASGPGRFEGIEAIKREARRRFEAKDG